MKPVKFLIVAIIFLVALPSLAVPDNFGLKVNPLPDGTTVSENFRLPVLMITQAPNNTTGMDWYLWAGTTVGTVEEAIATTVLYPISSPEDEWLLYLPAVTMNELEEGEYIWTIIATDANDGDSTTEVTGGPFTFTVDRPNAPIPISGSTLVGPGWPDFTFIDTGADWYQVWVGHGADAASPYVYTGIFKWYQADDDSVSATPGDGICGEGVCTLPAEDTTNVYVGGNEAYEWWLQSWSSADGLSDWELITSFELDYPSPATLLPASTPADDSTVSAIPTEITWDAEQGTLWYYIDFAEASANSSLFSDWVFAGDLCAEGMCAFDLAGEGISLNDTTTYEMAFEFWGPGGYRMFDNITDNPLTFTVEVTGDQAPTLATNATINVANSGLVTITDSFLLTTDPDTADADLTYTVTTAPVNGTLSLTTFTQDDITNAAVTYTHDGSETLTDSFIFEVTDGVNTAISDTFSITIDPIPPLPTR